MTHQSTIQPFEKGDVFAGATLLNDPEDDHAGDGRIIQYDSNLTEKGVLWTRGTTHLVVGLRFSPDGILWAFDSQEYKVVRVTTDGTQLPDIEFAQRPFSNGVFGAEGRIYLGEHIKGNSIKRTLNRRITTQFPVMPGTDRWGDGHLFQFSADGICVKEIAIETHGGAPGFFGITCSALAADGKTLIYVSELGGRLMRYDLEAERQLPDLLEFDPDSGDMTMGVDITPDGTLLLVTANVGKDLFALQLLSDAGDLVRSFPLEGRGWSNVASSIEGKFAYVTNFFTGQIVKVDLTNSEIVAQADTSVEKSLASIAQYAG